MVVWPGEHLAALYDCKPVVITVEVREVPVSFGGELGLLGLAVDPDYPSVAEPNMVRLFINYTATCRSGGGPCSFLERFDVDIAAGNGAPTVRAADPDNGYENPSVLFSTRQPAGNHNAGALLFDDAGLLYMSLGDGGSGDDPWCSGLNLYTPLGKVLRFDVHSGEVPYGIPAGNPFTEGSEGKCDNQIGALADDTPDLSRTEPCPEIFAYGLRNPFRMSYDSVRDAVWIGDVGQDAQEEIHFIDATADRPNFNLGWPAREGSEAKPGGLPDACTTLGEERDPLNTDYTAPRFIYRHTREQSSRSSVVAGFVYRGSALGDAYVGSFIFGDFGSSEIWVMDSPYGEGTIDVNGQEIEISERHVAYAEDENGESLGKWRAVAGRVRKHEA
ncbi:MAG: PQQ-dependent sugar dehydrogenase, partial [Myxococcota bacterium]